MPLFQDFFFVFFLKFSVLENCRNQIFYFSLDHEIDYTQICIFCSNDLSINFNIKQIKFFPFLLYYKAIFTTFNISLLLQNKLCEFPTCTHKFKRSLCSQKAGFNAWFEKDLKSKLQIRIIGWKFLINQMNFNPR